MLTNHQISTFLQLQQAMNSKVDPHWVAAKYPYMRAVVLEAAEAIEHHGWKWWKKQDKDLPQLQMELIDIWHFLLSEILLRNKGEVELSEPVLKELLATADNSELRFDGQLHEIHDLSLLDKLELLIATACRRRIEISLFSAIMTDCELTWSELYRQYVGKNVLNFFRQDFGYKEGTYQKMWRGREDNEYLVDVLNSLSPEQSDFREAIYQGLKANYPS